MAGIIVSVRNYKDSCSKLQGIWQELCGDRFLSIPGASGTRASILCGGVAM